MDNKQIALRKVQINARFWYIENHVKVVSGVHMGAGLALIDGKYESMNPDTLVYKSDPRKVIK